MPLFMRDDGVAPDAIADDGNYAGIFDYELDGEHFITVQFDNNDGQAMQTNLAQQYAPEPDGDTPDDELTLLGENFTRLAELQVTVTGWRPDDHTDDYFGEDIAPTLLSVDNRPIPGRMDFEFDADTFQINIPADYSGDLVVRVDSLAFDMDPYLYFFTEDFSWEYEAFLEFEPTSDDYLSVPLTVGNGEALEPGDVLYLQVYHFFDEPVGSYAISAGPTLSNDVVPSSAPSFTKPASQAIYLPLVLK
jgi:hypothetical protein